MKKFLISLNVFFLLIIVWQRWLIDDTQRRCDFAYECKNFWHEECAHWKIHGKGRP